MPPIPTTGSTVAAAISRSPARPIGAASGFVPVAHTVTPRWSAPAASAASASSTLPTLTPSTRSGPSRARAETGSFPGVSWLDLKDLQTALTTFESVLAARMVPLKIGEAGRSERKFGQFVSGNFFTALGVRPALGRLIVESDAAEAGGAPVAVLSYEFWQAHFEGSPAVIGQPLRVNDRPLTVIGVTPEGFIGSMSGVSFDVWVPGTLAPVLQPGSVELTSRAIRG